MDEFAVYNKYEIGFKKKYSRFKSIILYPLVYLFVKIGITANLVSFLGYITAIIFYLNIVYYKSISGILLFFFIYILFDNLDGSVAEKEGLKETGQFVDNYFDMTSLAFVIFGISIMGFISPGLGGLFILLYWIIVFGGILCNINGFKVLIFRLRIFPFFAFFLNVVSKKTVIDLNILLYILIPLQLISVITIVKTLILNKDRILSPPEVKNAVQEIKFTATLAIVILIVGTCHFIYSSGLI